VRWFERVTPSAWRKFHPERMRTHSNLSARLLRHVAARYGFSLLAVAFAFFVQWILRGVLHGYTPYLTLIAAIGFSAWYCGLLPSVIAVTVSTLAARYWFIRPLHSFQITNFEQAIGLATFLLVSGLFILMGEARRRDNEILQRAHADLEKRIQDRTADLDAANNSLRQLSARLMQLQDDERRRIARELHDSVGQMLVALGMNLSTVKADLERLTKAVNAVSDSATLVDELNKEIRTISHLLHPPLLDEAGLASALRWYSDGFAQRSKIQVDLDFPAQFGRLSSEMETAIFRVIQECLTNVHRHSGSPVAKIRVHRDGEEVTIKVADQGKGLSPEQRNKMAAMGTPGVGLRGMRERVRQLGGSLEINSDGEGKGTTIVVRLPVSTAASTVAA
jgi:signal transduction histidine kinase